MERFRVPLVGCWVRWSVVFVVAAAIFFASVVVEPDGTAGGLLGPHWDKFLHALAYAVLAFVLAYATATWRPGSSRRVLAVLAVTIGYGVVIELVQAAVPYRYFSPLDMGANAAGALLVLGWFGLEARVRYRRVAAVEAAVTDSTGREE